MSNLLEQASLVMIPSGYKEDIVYSVIPTSGAGDLTFTRASNGTRIDSNGNVEVVPWNLLEYSEDFTNGVWVKTNTTTSANTTTAPNGTTTADSLLETATTGDHRLWERPALIAGEVYSFTIYVKQNGRKRFQIKIFDASSVQASALFDVATGTIVATNGTSSIESVEDGWYRCLISATSPTTSTGYCVLDLATDSFTQSTASDSYAGDTSKGVYIWGAQLNIGSTAKPYFPTTDRLNVPRLTYQNGGGGCPSLLLEKQSTNLSNQSEDFASWPTQVNVTPTANYATSPDGTQNADRIQFTGAGFMYGANGYSQTSGVVYTLSCWAKRNGSGSQSVGFFVDGSGTINSAWSLSSEYQRFTYTYTAGNSSLVGIAGASGADVSVWGWQFEASSYATSYIPTTSSSATRVADSCYKNSISSLIGQSSGVVFADIVPFQFLDGSYIGISDNGLGNRQIFGFEGQSGNSGTLRFYGFYTGNFGTLYAGQRYKIAMAYANNDFVIYVNGAQVVNQTSGTVAGTLSHFGFDSYIANSQNFQGQVNEAILFPTRLTNSELAQLTGNQNYTINQAYESYGVASESPNCVQP